MSTFQQIRVETVDNGCRTRRGGVCAGVEARMQIAVFGASGRTGNLLTERALAGGHTVAALLRRPAEFPFRDRVRVVSGDAFDSRAIAETLEGADVVLSALGAR